MAALPVTMRRLLVVLAAGCAVPVAAQDRPVPPDSSLLAAREAVWRDWFAAAPGLAEALPADFVALNPGDSLWADRAATLASAAASAADGVRLLELRFPREVVQRHGEVAVVHSRYEAVLQRGDARWTMRGRITEVFTWDGRRWLHPSWHMEVDAPEGG